MAYVIYWPEQEEYFSIPKHKFEFTKHLLQARMFLTFSDAHHKLLEVELGSDTWELV